MNLDVLLGQLQLSGQEFRHLDTLVALHLDDFTKLFVLDDVAVAGEVLLQHLQDFLQVVFIGDPLHRGQRLSPVSLLDTDVDVVGGLGFRVASVSKGVKRVEVLDRRHTMTGALVVPVKGCSMAIFFFFFLFFPAVRGTADSQASHTTNTTHSL